MAFVLRCIWRLEKPNRFPALLMLEVDMVIRINSLVATWLDLSLEALSIWNEGNDHAHAALLRYLEESLPNMPEMSESPDCKPLSHIDCAAVMLPTRQKNALRLLFNKPSFSPEEVAALDYRVLERAPGIGKTSLTLIASWLRSHGYEMPSLPRAAGNQRVAHRQRKLERAIDYLRWHGYDVQRSR